MRRAQGHNFGSLQLHTLGPAAWAVISLATGAIATDSNNRLLMRLTEAEANRIAVEMTGRAVHCLSLAEARRTAA